MTVQDLIQKLQKFPTDMTVNFSCNIEHGRSNSFLEDGTLSLDEVDGEVFLHVWGEDITDLF